MESGYSEVKKGGVIIRRGNLVGKAAESKKDDKATKKVEVVSDRSTSSQFKKDGVVVIFDYDNTSLCSLEKRGREIDVPSMYDAVMSYAEKLGAVLRKEAFITTRTNDRDFVILNFFSLNRTPVVVVPPEKDAADEKMIESVQFSLMVPSIKAVVIVSDDSKAFGPLCKEIKESGREAHIVTTGFMSSSLSRAATKVVSLFDLIKRMGVSEKEKSNHQKDKFHHAARCVNLNLEPSNDEEKFVVACLDVARALTAEPGSWLNFYRLFENVWLQVGELDRRSFNLDDCRCAIESLINVQLIKKGTFSVSGRGSVGYFAR